MAKRIYSDEEVAKIANEAIESIRMEADGGWPKIYQTDILFKAQEMGYAKFDKHYAGMAVAQKVLNAYRDEKKRHDLSIVPTPSNSIFSGNVDEAFLLRAYKDNLPDLVKLMLKTIRDQNLSYSDLYMVYEEKEKELRAALNKKDGESEGKKRNATLRQENKELKDKLAKLERELKDIDERAQDILELDLGRVSKPVIDDFVTERANVCVFTRRTNDGTKTT